MLQRTLISILFGLAAGLAMREPSSGRSRGTATAAGGHHEAVRRIDSLENAVVDIRRCLEQLGAEQSRAASSLREWVEERLAGMDNRLVQGEAGQAGSATRKLDDRLQQHAEAIQQLEDRVVRLERSNRELGLRLEQLQSPARAAKALSA
jgi:chromosome segregation ATPase